MNGSGPGLALGTAQFGLAYGVAGRGEAVPEAEARAILERAAAAGVRVVDTAPAYGDIESRLGRLAGDLDLTFVSKIARLPPDAGDERAIELTRRSVAHSVERLGPRLRTLLFHHADDLLPPRGERLWRAAAAEAGPGIGLGVSCYSPAALLELCGRHPIAVAQLPGNAFDQRLAGEGIADRLHGVEVHLRSVFLQGLLLMSAGDAVRRVPAAAGPIDGWVRWCAARHARPVAAALAIARALPRVRLCVVGVDRVEQFEDVRRAWNESEPVVVPSLASERLDVIDPRCWTTARS